MIAQKDFLRDGKFCPDVALAVEHPDFPARIQQMEETLGFTFACIKCIKRGLTQMIGTFAENGGKAACHSPLDVPFTEATDMELTPIFKKAKEGQALTEAEIAAYKTGMVLHCAKQYAKNGIALEAAFQDDRFAQAL